MAHGFKDIEFWDSVLAVQCCHVRRKAMLQYFTFKLRIVTWSVGCVMKVVFFGRKSKVIAFRFSIWGWAGQLSMIYNHSPSFIIKLAIQFTQPFFKGLFTHLAHFFFFFFFFFFWCQWSKYLILEKCLGFWYFPIMNIGSFSL